MAHFAKVENGIVTRVIVVSNNALDNGGDFPDAEASGQTFLASLGFDGEWLQTSYNGNFRGNYAGIGDWYSKELDIFIPPQPYPSWTVNQITKMWESPTPMPEDGFDYVWDESTLSWGAIDG